MSTDHIIRRNEILQPIICDVPRLPDLLWNSGRISKSILEKYFSQVPKAKKYSDINIYSIAPFLTSVYGAYPLMTSWKDLVDKMEVANNESDFSENLNLSSKNDSEKESKTEKISNGYNTTKFNFKIDYREYKKEVVLERLKVFAEGFKYGYNSYLDTFINSPDSISNSDAFKIQRTMDYIEKSLLKHRSFPTIDIEDNNESRIQQWFDFGISSGCDYHAWYSVFIDHKIFEPYFDNILLQKEKIDQKLNLPSIFIDENAFQVCKYLMEELEITIDGIPNLKIGRIGKLTGLISAIRNYRHLMLRIESLNESQLLPYFNSFLNTDYKTFSTRNKDYEPSLQDAEIFIKKSLKK